MRSDFVTGEDKTYSKIKRDLQLHMYYYVLAKKFPNTPITANLFYIRDGGIFTVSFDLNDNKKYVEDKLKEHFDEVRNCKIPKLLDSKRESWKCNMIVRCIEAPH